jgi:PAS domain S-box-containing protein
MDQHAIIVADASGIIQLWSPGAERLLGYSAAEAVGQTLDLIVPEEFRDQHWSGFRRAMSSGMAAMEGQAFDLPVKPRDGQVTPVPGTFILIRTGAKTVIGAMAILSAHQQDAAT